MELYTRILLGMLIGLVAGVLCGPNGALMAHDALSRGTSVVVMSQELTMPVESPSELTLMEVREGWAHVSWGEEDSAEDAAQEGWVQMEPGNATQKTYSRLGQTLVDRTYWMGQIFLNLLKMVVVPLVFCSLTVGVASLGDMRRLGRVGGRTLGLFVCTTVAALSIGVTLASLIQPGNFLSTLDKDSLRNAYAAAADGKVATAEGASTGLDQLVALVPINPLSALAEGDMLPIIFFALIFGVALTRIRAEESQAVQGVLKGIDATMVVLVDGIMYVAPIGVAALLFKVAGTTGMSVLAALGVYCGVVVAGLLLHLTLVYGGLIRFGAKLPILQFLRALRPAMLTAFSTSSSSATLPITKRCVEEGIGVSPSTASFVLPLGATVNMDGTALYQGVAAMFIAQLYGIDLTLVQQLTIVLSATLASVGAAGVPGAGMITLTMVLSAIHVPLEGIALVIGVDRLLDMCRTTVNIVGDSAITAVVARLEGENLEIRSNQDH